MSDLTRSAKSGSDWTTNDLLAYNIKVSSQSSDMFFSEPLPPLASLSNLDPHLLFATLDMQGLSTETYRLLQYLDLASKVDSSAIYDFTKEILCVLGYEKRGLLQSRCTIPLLISGDPNQSAQTGVCLTQGSLSTILLVVQGDKNNISVCDPEPQVIAEAIATFQCNNRTRAHLGEPELESMTVPCIAMVGTRPIFYLVPVTQQLSKAVAAGQYPLSRTVVKRCVVASRSHRLSEGMESLNFRQLALQHLVAFRTLAEAHWSTFKIPNN